MNNEYSADPIEQLRAWLDTEVVALATATSTGAPSVRMVLLKDADERGLLFFTNYEGRKGRELAENPQAAMLFHLDGRQIRVEGRVEKVDPAESDIYWEKRPRESQISAWVSRQSEPIESREELDRRLRESSTRPIQRSSPARRTGAAFASSRRATSSGSTATTASTIAFATAARARAGSVERLQP